jgi:hypothetical protein
MANATLASSHQAMPIQHRVHRTDRRQLDIAVKPPQLLADLWRAPARVFLLQLHDQRLNLKRAGDRRADKVCASDRSALQLRNGISRKREAGYHQTITSDSASLLIIAVASLEPAERYAKA